MGILPQHGDQISETWLITLAHAVKLISPERGGIDQDQRLQGKRDANAHRQDGDPPAPDATDDSHQCDAFKAGSSMMGD